MKFKQEIIIDKTDFYIPPDTDSILINKNGICIDIKTGGILRQYINSAGYKVIHCYYKSKRISYSIHRLLAKTFIKIPNELINLYFNEITVNHKDGNKLNNLLDNLEWCLKRYNVQHAYKNNLDNQSHIVLVKNIISNLVTKYPSISACAKHFNIKSKNLYKHLQSKSSGKITLNWCVFKYDNNLDWPQLHPNDITETKWELFNLVIVRNLNNSNTFIFNTIKEAAEDLNLDVLSIYDKRINKGSSFIYKDWLFEIIETPEGIDVSKLKSKKWRKGRSKIKYFLIDISNNNKESFNTAEDLSNKLNISTRTIYEYVKNRNGKIELLVNGKMKSFKISLS